MNDWQERITRETPPAIQAEHELRYLAAVPVIAGCATWADLGCGNGVAAADALGDERPPHAVLVDLEEHAVAAAAAELSLPEAELLSGDLTDRAVLTRIREALLAHPGPRTVSCFEVIEHLTTFVPLIEWAMQLAAEHDTTFVISVPNDALWSIENPFHAGRWGEGAFAELTGLLGSERTLLHQVALTGSALVPAGETAALRAEVEVASGRPPSHYLASFGPRHRELRLGAIATAHDQREQRGWERQRESNLAFAEADVITSHRAIQKLEADLAYHQDQIRALRGLRGRNWRARALSPFR